MNQANGTNGTMRSTPGKHERPRSPMGAVTLGLLLVGVAACQNGEGGEGGEGNLTTSGGSNATTVSSSTTTSGSTSRASSGSACAPNACGGCVALAAQPGDACATASSCQGHVVCNGADATRCQEDPGCPSGSSGATRLRAADFDDGTLGPFGANNDDVAVVDQGVDGTPCQSGKCVRIAHNGAVEWNDPYATSMVSMGGWPYERSFLVRFWMRLDADYDPQNGSKFFKMQNEVGDQFILGSGIDDDPTSYDPQCALAIAAANGGVDYRPWFVRKPCLYDNAWHAIAYFIEESNGDGHDGTIRIWFDGELVVDWTDVATHRPGSGNTWGADILSFPSNWSSNPGWEHDATNHMYIDGFELFSDADGGDATIGDLADNTIRVP